MNTDQTINLAAFAESPDNPSTASDDAIARLMKKLRKVPDRPHCARHLRRAAIRHPSRLAHGHLLAIGGHADGLCHLQVTDKVIDL